MGKTRLAITWGHNKDHRPDLKQLLFILTVAKDGGVPVYFQAKSGNVADDPTHRDTWDLLCKLTGRRDFLYVADCKLASTENMAYVHGHGGRFLTVLPRTRSEDRTFREALAGGRVRWRWVHDKYDEEGKLVDRFRVSEPAATSVEGYRLEWYHSIAQGRTGCLGPHAATGADLEGLGGAPAEADFPTDTLPPASQGDRGGGGDPAGPRDDGLD